MLILGIQTLAATAAVLIAGFDNMPVSILNAMFVTGFLFALTGVLIRAVNNNWFAYFRKAFPKADNAKPAEDVAGEDRRETHRDVPPAAPAKIKGSPELILSGALFTAASAVLSFFVK